MAKARGNDARGADEGLCPRALVPFFPMLIAFCTATQTVDEIMDRAMQKMMEEMIQVYGNLMMARELLPCWMNCRSGSSQHAIRLLDWCRTLNAFQTSHAATRIRLAKLTRLSPGRRFLSAGEWSRREEGSLKLITSDGGIVSVLTFLFTSYAQHSFLVTLTDLPQNPKMAALIGPDPTQVYKGDYSGASLLEDGYIVLFLMLCRCPSTSRSWVKTS